MRTARLSLLASLLLVLGSMLMSPAQAAPPTCDGQSATIVGNPDETDLNGTDGDDVIVTNGSRSVETGGGTDLVCTTDSSQTIEVVATSPDVTIDSSGDDMGVSANLDGGDTFTGSGYADRVDLGLLGDSTTSDTVSTGAGDDVVASYYDGRKGHLANSSSIDLGAGDDKAYISAIAPGASVLGGSGTNKLFLPDNGTADKQFGWDVDLARHRLVMTRGTGATAAVPVTAPLSGFTWVHSPDHYKSFAVEGTAAAEHIIASRTGRSALPVSIHAGGGDDVVQVVRGLPGTVDGGPGDNSFTSFAAHDPDSAQTTVDLSRHRLLARHQTVRLTRFEQVQINDAQIATVIGTPGADHIRVQACTAVVRSLAGDDVITLSHPAARYGRPGLDCGNPPRKPPAVRAYADGGPGDDDIIGTPQDDVLIGGPGHDSIDGGAGRDTCRAEVTIDCP